MKLQWPLDNVHISASLGPEPYPVYISQVFGNYLNGYYSKYNMKGHNGLDIAAPLGTPVKAAHDGFIVEQTAHETGYGLRITLYFEDGGEWDLTHGHLQRLERNEDISVNYDYKGYPVKAGDTIGYVNSTGDSTGNHLHFGLRQLKNGQVQNYDNGFFGSIDPLPYLISPDIQYLKRNEQFWQINPDGTEAVVTDEGVLKELYFGGLSYKTIN